MVASKDRVAFITGASGGLGTALVGRFLDEGWRVAGVARSWPKLERPNDRFLTVSGDLGSPQGASRAFASALEATGRIDAVVHAVGAFAGGQPVAETEDETWNKMLAVNLTSAFYVLRASLPHLLSRRHGRIIAIGSRVGVEPAATLSAYGVSKAGLLALIRTIALEVAGTGVTANVVLPSIIDTPANRASDPTGDHSRWVTPESIANLVLWLASDGSADVNGAAIPIYG